MDNNLPQSITILGRQPALGLAELESLYGAALVSSVAPQVAGLSLDVSMIDFERLGGSTRLAEVITEVPSKLWKDVEKALIKAIPELTRDMPEGKLQLGFSVFDIPITPAKLNASALTIKKVVRSKTDRSVRIIPNPELELNTAQVVHNHLVSPNGIEMLIMATNAGTTLLARTVQVQNIASYTMRDRMRPKRDARVGMLPPKLAQIIINLATHAESGGLLWDPFCGTGVLLQEALLMNMPAYGSDLEPRMIEYTQANISWLDEHFNLPKGTLAMECMLQVADATSIQVATTDTPIRFVATETYLGRPFTERPSSEMVMQTSTEVNLILKKFLKNIHGQLQPGTTLCLAVPAWQVAPDQFRHLPLIDQIEDLGYNRTRFEHASNEELLYYREDQFTARELLVLTRK